ncbi:MAG: hypothetical protein P1V51_22735 [Deltaproteobacteria bacterium]|nr:hypothetical protein [Deltaproteobacteria bacterium]
MGSATRRESLAPEFLRPAPLLAVAVLALNDHWLKGADLLPGWLTGKLSDLAGLFFFPLFLSALVGLLTRRPPGTRRLAVCAGITALAFTALQLWPAFRSLYLDLHRALLPSWHFTVTADPTDLLALPMCALAFWYGHRRLTAATAGD